MPTSRDFKKHIHVILNFQHCHFLLNIDLHATLINIVAFISTHTIKIKRENLISIRNTKPIDKREEREREKT